MTMSEILTIVVYNSNNTTFQFSKCGTSVHLNQINFKIFLFLEFLKFRPMIYITKMFLKNLREQIDVFLFHLNMLNFTLLDIPYHLLCKSLSFGSVPHAQRLLLHLCSRNLSPLQQLCPSFSIWQQFFRHIRLICLLWSAHIWRFPCTGSMGSQTESFQVLKTYNK